ncbi:MAG: hypothetical protein R3E02_13675 [Blastomonas sp.]
MRGLTCILLTPDRERFEGLVMMAMAHAALHDEGEARTRIFCHAPAVPLLALPGGPMLAEARSLGILFIACQTGLAEHGLKPEDLVAGTQISGPIAIFSDLGDDRLVMC